METLDGVENESFDHDHIQASRKETLTYLKKLLSEIDFSMETIKTDDEDRMAKWITSMQGTELGLNQICLLRGLLLKYKNTN